MSETVEFPGELQGLHLIFFILDMQWSENHILREGECIR